MSGSVNLAEMYRSGLSTAQISESTGLNRSRVRRDLLAQGVRLRTIAEATKLAGPRMSRSDIIRGSVRSPESRRMMSIAKQAWAEKNAVGVSLKSDGYIEHTRGEHKGRGVHVVLMEKRLGRRLLPDEVVHHIDGNPSNNEENNLALMTRSGHTRLHQRERKLAKAAS